MALSNGAVINKDLLAGGVLAVPSTTTVYSATFAIPAGYTFGYELLFSSDGTVAVDISVEQGDTPPATESAADTNMVVAEGAGTLIQVSNELVHTAALVPVVSNFLRLKVTGTGANHASTSLDRFIINQRPVA